MNYYTTAQNLAITIGRILFAALFILSSINKIYDLDGTMAYIMQTGIHTFAREIAILSIIFELVGSMLVLFGWHAKFGAFLLFTFTIMVTISIQHFWSYPAEVLMFNILKNVSMLGGALYIMSFGAGAYSIDGMLYTKKCNIFK